ncbi:carbohydrate ABC transporter permease [Aeromonas encheleia]|uniref:Sugar ABC transporter permease n=1 Tax=Aeromonas encheleia TaxID=73010 RepID=A0AAE9MEI0_9GAMM|nr:sugar ABC transporter permease [Aeromonas encheleia]USV56804.1 sugar ABC transporter permease [Aeromonas encheleia]
MTPWLMLAPFLLAFLTFFVIPAFQTLQLSFTDSGLTETHGYVGFANYVALLQDPSFWASLLQTAYFALLTVIPLTALGLVMAMLINRLRRFGGLVQAIFFIPNILPIAVMAMIGGWMLHPTFGVVNLVAGTEVAWFNEPDFAMPMVAIATIWWTVGFNVLLFLAALKNIPQDLYEAARLDGASEWGIFRYITWRQLRPVTVMVFGLQLVASLKIFGQTYLLTGGGPFDSTKVVLHYMYETGFVNQDAGYASAIAVVFVLIVLLILLLQSLITRFINRRG